MRMRSGALAVVVLALLAACSSGSDPSSSDNTNKDALSGADIVRRVSLRESDVKSNHTVELVPGGDQVTGEVTLDLCGALFPSEQARRVRHQVAAVLPSGSAAGIGSEAVLYDSPESAQQALDEVRAAQAKCPEGLVPSRVPEVPPLTTTFAKAPDGDWSQHAGIDRLAQDVTISTDDGRSLHKYLIFQVRDALLVGLYVTPETAPKQLSSSIGDVEGLVEVIADRMAAVPATALTNAPAV
jgi:hypothetical protein